MPDPQRSKVFPYPAHQGVLENGLKVAVIPFDSPGLGDRLDGRFCGTGPLVERVRVVRARDLFER